MKISKSLAIATDTETSAVTLTFVDENGTEQAIHVPPQAADLLLLGLLASPPSRRADGKTSAQRQPLLVHGAQSLQFENGHVGLSLHVADNAYLQIAFPKEAIQHLQGHLSRLLSEQPPAVH